MQFTYNSQLLSLFGRGKDRKTLLLSFLLHHVANGDAVTLSNTAISKATGMSSSNITKTRQALADDKFIIATQIGRSWRYQINKDLLRERLDTGWNETQMETDSHPLKELAQEFVAACKQGNLSVENTGGFTWYKPLGAILTAADGQISVAKWAVREAVSTLLERKYTVSSPRSIEKTALGMIAQDQAGTQWSPGSTTVQSTEKKVWRP